MTVTLLYFDGCPNWQVAEQRLTALADELGFALEKRKVGSPDEAEQLGFIGSPTILVDGHDPFRDGDEPASFSCRIYQTPEGPAGSPTVEQLRDALA